MGEAVLGDLAALAVGDVGGGDVDEVGPRAGALEALEQADRAEGVEGEGLVEGLLEGDRRCAVDDGVDARPARRRRPPGRPRRGRRRSPGSGRRRRGPGRRARRRAPRRAGGGRASSSEGALSSTTSRSIPSPWRSSAASTALPRNPEAPVTRTLLPASLSRTRWFPSLVTGAILGIAPGRPPRRGREVAPGGRRNGRKRRLNTIFRNGAPNATATTQVAYLEVEKDPGPARGPVRRACGRRAPRPAPGRSTSTTRRRRSPACSRSRRAARRRSTPPTAA